VARESDRLGHDLGKTRDPGRSESERMAGFAPSFSPSQFQRCGAVLPKEILIPPPRPGAPATTRKT
jgi:hypothetical protein